MKKFRIKRSEKSELKIKMKRKAAARRKMRRGSSRTKTWSNSKVKRGGGLNDLNLDIKILLILLKVQSGLKRQQKMFLTPAFIPAQGGEKNATKEN